MKILAATPKNYGHESALIVEMSSDELSSLAALCPYTNIEVKDKNNAIKQRDFRELQAGDFVDSSVFKEHYHKASEMRQSREEIAKAAATMRGALTKLLNVLPEDKE